MKPGIELVWQPDPTLRLIKIDPVQWDQVIMNLCVNASDALNGPGKIVIRTRNSVPSDSAESFVVVSVEDNGPGMEPEVLEKIFEPFFTTKPAGKGTGLGLATVYGIVQQNKGRIEVTSRPGQGTVFSMFFPTIDG
jgi:signal transduction histidine kinase